MATPTVRKLQLGNELRRLREDAGRTSTEAAKVIDADVSKISRLEQGQSGIAVGDLKLLLDLYGTDAALAEFLTALSRGNRERGRWTGHRAAFPEWFRRYVDLEADAEDIRWAEIEVVPGVLQTEAYMRALFVGAAPLNGPADVNQAVQTRLERQAILMRADPPTLSFALSESCVRRVVGGPAVMAEQLEHLCAIAERPHVQLQLRPFDAVSTAGVEYRFTVLRVPSPGSAPPLEFVYLENGHVSSYLEDRDSLRVFGAAWGALQAAALGPVETQRKLCEMAREYREVPG